MGLPTLASANTFQQLAGEGLFLPELRRRQKAVADSPDNRGAQAVLAQYLAILGDEAGAMRAVSGEGGTPPDLAGARPEPAIEAIVRQARGRRLVILNEHHQASRCRGFAALVVRRLRQEGFDAFLAEAFPSMPAEAAAPLTKERAVTGMLGLYVCDPAFADMVREARDLGYAFGAYEQSATQAAPPGAGREAQIASREAAQAENIAAFMARNPEARLIVYCGHSHIAEKPVGPALWMAGRLQALTGVDPLTIDQSMGLPPPDPAGDGATLTAVLAAYTPTRPIVVGRSDGSFLGMAPYEGSVDLTVFHPRLTEVDSRPGWLARDPARRRQAFRLSESAPAGALVQAVPLSETSETGALPSDQYMAKPGAKEAIFFLRPGSYEVRMETDAGRRILGRL